DGADLSTSTTPMSTHPTSTTSVTSTTHPAPSVLEVRLTSADYSDVLVFEDGVVAHRVSLPDYERTAELTPSADSTLAAWTEAVAESALGGVYNDGRGLGESPFWEYAFHAGEESFEVAFSWLLGDDVHALKPLVEWVTSVRLAMVQCAPHRDLIERRGCENLLPSPAEQASMTISSVIPGAPGPGGDTSGPWRRPGAVDADLADRVRQAMDPVLRSDTFTGEVTVSVLALREDGGFYAMAEDTRYGRICFARWTPDRVLSNCQRILGDVFWAPGTLDEGSLELVMRPVERLRTPASVRYYQTLTWQDPRDEAGLLAGGVGLFVIPDPPPWSLWVAVGDSSWAMPSVSTCTAGGLDPAPIAGPGLPDAVAQTRSALVDAAITCDSEALAALPDVTGSLPHPMHRWYLRTDFFPVHDAAPVAVRLWPIVQLLSIDFAVVTGGTISSEADLRNSMWRAILDDPTQDVFVWPAADLYATRSATPSSLAEAAARINLEAAGRDGFVDGSYCGWSIGIRADGRILWAGDCHDSLA
ncbi:MAG TPA: hypothetical protein VMM81_02235, partial [Acidimicrobiia bacterium]|nr:hypothetical protein [Acidimicrobiia bacterium]